MSTGHRGSQSQGASGGRIFTRGYVEWALSEWTMAMQTGESLNWGKEGHGDGRGNLGGWDSHIHNIIYGTDHQEALTAKHREAESTVSNKLYRKRA